MSKKLSSEEVNAAPGHVAGAESQVANIYFSIISIAMDVSGWGSHIMGISYKETILNLF